MAFVERIENLALDVLAAHRRERRFHLGLDGVAQGFDVVEAEALGEFVVQLAGVRAIDMEHVDFELGLLAGQFCALVVGGEGDLDFAGLALLHADQLLFEAGDELARADGQVRMVGRAAIERLAVDLADERQAETVAILDDAVVALVGVAAVLGEHAVALRRRLPRR